MDRIKTKQKMKSTFNSVELKQKIDQSYYRKDFIQKEITNYFFYTI
jgi:hypothetical protein